MAQTMKRGVNRQGAIVRCARKSCKLVIARLDEAEYRQFTYIQPNEIFCVACKAWGNVSEVYGRFVAEIVCGSKCTGAIGNSCDCSCGGVNHGGSHAA